ncbi:MAG: HAD family phosphatase [Thermoproteota archaeon]|nr:HAD family phosphatase [Thermoproteota archaeon]
MKKKGIIFDLDGVLVNSMPSHFQAWKGAFAKITGIEITERDIYLLEGMRGLDLVAKIFEQKNFHDYSLVQNVHDEKSRIFKEIRISDPFEGVKEMVESIRCSKAVVSGSTKHDVETMLDNAFGKDGFDVIIAADDIKKGKPDPDAFLEALRRMNLRPAEGLVVENAPLGVMAANNASIECFVVLNNTPLTTSDFDRIIPQEKIFEKTSKLGSVIEQLCR